MSGYIQTGQVTCYDSEGREVACEGSGQDAESSRGVRWPEPRFEAQGETVFDRLTGLHWLRDGNPAEFPLNWSEAFEFVASMNRKRAFGMGDWRIPNRRELRSLMSHQTRRPALPQGHPFINVISGWYWSSTTAAIHPAYAWYVHMEGGRMFYGAKSQSCLIWPVRGEGSGVLAATGQVHCFDDVGRVIPCAGAGQDGELRLGRQWPVPRFAREEDCVLDRLTGLRWRGEADLTGKPVTWSEALSSVARLGGGWRLPNINELESLVDCSSHSPALPREHPFRNPQEAYWSSTTSAFEPDWAWALYLAKGAVGVGHKRGPHFSVWPVRH